MSDFIAKRSKELVKQWARESDSRPNFPSCSVRLDNTLNNTNATRQETQLFKMPNLPMRNNTQTSTRMRPNTQFSQSKIQHSQNTNNSTISQSSMKFLLENTRKSFLKCLDSYLVDFEHSTSINEEQALLMYTTLNGIVCDAMTLSSSDKSDEGRLGKMFVEFAKTLNSLIKPSNACGPGTSSSQDTDLEYESDPTEFELAAFHSTQIGNSLHEPNHHQFKKDVVSNPPSSLQKSTASKHSVFENIFQSKIQNKDRGAGYAQMYSNSFKNYTSIPTEQLLGESSANARFQETNYERLSPDLSQYRSVRQKSDKTASKINAAKVKGTLSRKLDQTISFPCTPITNWTIKRNGINKIELFGCDPRFLSNKPVSQGIVLRRKGKSMIRTDKGLYQLVGSMKQTNALPSLVREKFRNDFPHAWKKTLNQSGLLK